MKNDAHASPKGQGQELLYDPDIPTPSHAEQARTLVDSIQTGTISTIAREPEGFPYGSFITFAIESGNPVFLISALAEHTKNLQGDSRASLLVAQSDKEDPLANGRVTLVGPCKKVSEESKGAVVRDAYLKKLPNASYYVDFKDFSFWQLTVESVRYIGGYGRMSWVSRDEWFAATPDPIATHAKGIIEHMNQDHTKAMAEYCRAFSKATEANESDVKMTSVDRYGFEMSVVTKQGPRPVRIAFPQKIQTPNDARAAMVELAKRARASL